MRGYTDTLGSSQGRKIFAAGAEHHILEWGRDLRLETPAPVSGLQAEPHENSSASPPDDPPRPGVSVAAPFEGDGARTSAESAQPVVLLLHGYMDVAASWDLVAPELAGAGFRVIAPDLRGFGRAPRAAAGSVYYFPDYVADVAALLDALKLTARVSIVGHSMGGVVATLFAGTFPERVRCLASLEGLGPPDSTPEASPDRMRNFIADSARFRDGRLDRPMASLDEAASRLQLNHPRIPREVLLDRARNLTYRREDGAFAWWFDPMHRVRSPVPFYAAAFRAFAKRITSPVLYLDGGPTGYHPPDEAKRLAAFADLRTVTLPDAGHMMHWTEPGAVAGELVAFLSSPGASDP